ncbi:Uncharacterised protein [BD1-7 clade bacterium]|uniref:HPr kinase/phosphorylase n=1 Tax=BD1-7 clade bacterium TaxID=2029982 RepID=A0A5S9PEN2_9GAMM|nr:Uncharacterised protein [BD1-7 clade bacterium]
MQPTETLSIDYSNDMNNLHYFDASIFGLNFRFEVTDPSIESLFFLAFPSAKKLSIIDGGEQPIFGVCIDVQVPEISYTREAFCYQFSGDTYVAENRYGSVVVGLQTNSAEARVSRLMLDDTDYFISQVLHFIGFLFLCWNQRIPVHAAAVNKEGHTLLLIGQSGIGKSSLTYACWKQGWNILSEDTTFLHLADGIQIWGNPLAIHLLPESQELFPELANIPVIDLPNGKKKRRIPLLQQKDFVSKKISLCFLEAKRESRDSVVETVKSHQVIQYLQNTTDSGFDLPFPGKADVMDSLGKLPAFRVSIGSDIDLAVKTLSELVEYSSK